MTMTMQQPGPPRPTKEDLTAIIIDGNSEKLVEWAEKIGKYLSRDLPRDQQLTTSQIRNFFGAVRKIQMDWPSADGGGSGVALAPRAGRAQRAFLLLKPKLAYAAARERRRGVEFLKDVLTQAIGDVGADRTRFENFVDFFEAILAYHRAYGGQ